MNPTYDFKGQVALVTGALPALVWRRHALRQSGRGRCARRYQQNARLKAATEALTSKGRQAIGVACDVRDEAQAAAIVEARCLDFGRLDCAYNNAGILGPMCDMTEETAQGFDEVNAVNLRGVWTCMKHEIVADA